MTLAIPVAARAVLGAVGAGTVLGAATLVAAPAVFADPLPPNCTAADLAQVQTGVSAATSVYFFTHPDVNAFFTGLQGSPPDTVRAQIADYMAANPQVQIELSGIRQPMVDMRTRCGGSGDDES